jgi:hypothetical protein
MIGFNRNIKKLKSVHKMKNIIIWSKFVFDRLGLFKVWSRVMNFFLDRRRVGIRYGNEMIYRQYSKVFKNSFKKTDQFKKVKELLFFFAMGAESTYNSRNLMLAKYFESRGWNAEYLICDGIFNLCHKERIGKTRKNSSFFCFECNYGYHEVERQTGMNFHRLGKLHAKIEDKFNLAVIQVEKDIHSINDCRDFCFEGYPIGDLCRVSVLRYHYSGDLKDGYFEVYKSYIKEAIRCLFLFQEFLTENKSDLVVFWNGAGFMDRIACELCRREGIDFVTQESFWGDSSWIYKKNGIAIHLDYNLEYDQLSREIPFELEDRERLQNLLESFRGNRDEQLHFDISKELGIEEHEKFVVLFTNMNFDTYVLGRDKVFESMTDWLIKTIGYWKTKNPKVKLVIRAHPGELKFVTPSTDFVRDVVNPLRFEGLIFIDSDQKTDSYDLVKHAEAVLVYSSTIGMESILMGKNVISSGSSFYDRFVKKPCDVHDYYDLLDNVLAGKVIFDVDLEKMKRYLNYLYFHRIVELKGMGINRVTGENYINTDINSDELILLNEEPLGLFYSEIVNEYN